LRSLRHFKQVMPRLGLKFSSLVVVAAAKENASVDWAPFIAEGCTVASENGVEILKSPVGAPSFCTAFCRKAGEKQAAKVKMVAQLPDPHVAYYLLRWSCNASRMNHLARTTPLEICRDGLRTFDAAVSSAVCHLTRHDLSDTQRSQAALPVKEAGLGLKRTEHAADAAYLGSRVAVQSLCERIRPTSSLGADVVGSPVQASISRCDAVLADAGMLSRLSTMEIQNMSQTSVGKLLERAAVKKLRSVATPDDNCRMNAYSAPHAGKALDTTPSQAIDMSLTASEFVTEVSLRLGVDVCEGGQLCKFCGLVMDRYGRHSLSCMAGGDKTVAHNLVRDCVYDYCRRGRLEPKLEAPGLLGLPALPGGLRRPADVLVCCGRALEPELPDGSRATRFRSVALDFAVVNAMGQGHWNETAQEAGRAAEAYAAQKRSHQNTEAQCSAKGIRFQPMVMEAQGGLSRECSATIHKIAEAVASAEHRSTSVVREEIFQRLALIRARGAHSALARRRQASSAAIDDIMRASLASSILEEAEGDGQ
jgi:hypothetical protein